jgi:hypothetical protein
MKQLVYFLLFAAGLTSCYKPEIIQDLDGFIVYTIKKGEHYSGSNLSFKSGDTIECLGIMTESCIYTIDSINQCDINKLFGLSDALSHSDDSARFGWRYYNNDIEILAYVRRGSNFYFEILGTVNAGDVERYKIEILKDVYRFTFKDKVFNMPRTSNYKGPRYTLYPFFGGNITAPHDITIKLKKI